jgi:DNA polymerase-3 subunit alpha
VRVTEPVIQEIMDNRPFSSLDDFLTKVTKKIVTKDKVINLIKCGAFDKVENKTRREILNDYIWKICEPKSKLTMQNMNMLIDLELLPKDLEYVSDVYKLTKELRKNRDANKMWYCGDRLTIPPQKFNAWAQIIKDSKLVAHEIMLDGEPRRVIDSAQWDRFYELKMEVAKRYIKENHDELLKLLNNTLFNNEFEKYCSGNELQWELDSINFYFTSHPLDNVAPQIDENICGANDVIEGAQDGEFIIKGKVIPRMRLYSIIGTVIDKDKVKGLVTIQCPDGVVNVKIYKNLFALYNQTISNVNEVGEKEIEDESFFEKGTHLLVTGIQRGATFVPKVYKNTGYKSIMRIVLDDNGKFVQLQEKEGEA